MPLSRRSFLRTAVLATGAAVLAHPADLLHRGPGGIGTAAFAAGSFDMPLPIPEVRTGSEVVLHAKEALVPILPGPRTRMWTFDGTFPGPTIKRPAGARTSVTVVHELPEEVGSLTIHNHGNHSAAEHDGTILNPIPPGGSHTYVYDLAESGAPAHGRLQWYHDHTHHRTGRNVWMGLAGMFLVTDALEDELGLPSDEFDIPLLITDRQLDEDNQLVDRFTAPGRDQPEPGRLGSGYPPFDEAAGIGNRILVNGVPTPHLEVAARRYRFRILNASNFVPINVARADGVPLVQVGTEGGLLPAPIERASVLLGPAERAEIVIDLGDHLGRDIVLESIPLPPRQVLGRTAPKVEPLLQLRVVREPDEPDTTRVPDVLRPAPGWVGEAGDAPDRVLAFGLGTDEHGQASWTINGRAFDHERVEARPELGTVETWMLANLSPPGFSHYIHLHHTDWVVLSRNGDVPPPEEAGPKETFRLDPGEVVLVAARFSDHTGPYMAHCHMLEHEDHGMMVRFDVVEPGEGALPPDPLGALTGTAPAQLAAVLSQLRARPGVPADTADLGRVAAAPGSPSALSCRLEL